MWYRSSYIPHALYSVALLSISIHSVGTRTACSEERARINARISILESISEQMRSNKSLSDDELERLKRLARPPEKLASDSEPQKIMAWKDIFLGQRGAKGESEMSKWEKIDVEKGREALNCWTLSKQL